MPSWKWSQPTNQECKVFPSRASPTRLQASLNYVCVCVCPTSVATQVVVALQHEDGSRVQGTFPPISSLWDVVIQLQGSPPDNGQTEPVLVYMNQQVGGALQATVAIPLASRVPRPHRRETPGIGMRLPAPLPPSQLVVSYCFTILHLMES